MKLQPQLLMFFASCMASVPLHAEEPQMVVKTVSGEPVQIGLSTDTRITFSADQMEMIVSNPGEKSTFDIDDISSIEFTILSGVDTPVRDIDGLKISSKGKVVTISGTGEIEYIVVDLSGRRHFFGKAADQVTLDFSDLVSGIYIVKANNTSFKFINR